MLLRPVRKQTDVGTARCALQVELTFAALHMTGDAALDGAPKPECTQ